MSNALTGPGNPIQRRKDSPFVTRQEYDKLLAEHEALKAAALEFRNQVPVSLSGKTFYDNHPFVEAHNKLMELLK